MKIIKLTVYFIVFIITLWAMSGINLNNLFKQGRIMEARILYLFFAMAISYLVTNFIYDFMSI